MQIGDAGEGGGQEDSHDPISFPSLDLIRLTNKRASARIRAAKTPDDVSDVISPLPGSDARFVARQPAPGKRGWSSVVGALKAFRLKALIHFLPRGFFLSAWFWRFVLAKHAWNIH